MEVVWLAAAGVGAGLTGSVAGLASVASYPALLAVGLPPVAASVTNTVALTANSLGAALGSQPELAGRRQHLVRLCLPALAGGLCGSALLLGLPASVFATLVPGLVAVGSLLVLSQLLPRLRPARRAGRRPHRSWHVAVFAGGVYTGYFAAASGIVMLAILSFRDGERFAVTNAAKNVVTGVAGASGAVVYAVAAPVDWAAAAWLAAGALAGSWCGPRVVRVIPEAVIRSGIGVAGLVLATQLWLSR